MTKKKQKTIEERIEEKLLNAPSLIHFDATGRLIKIGDWYKVDWYLIGAIKELFSDLLREIVGEEKSGGGKGGARNKLRREIRQRAKKLGIEI